MGKGKQKHVSKEDLMKKLKKLEKKIRRATSRTKSNSESENDARASSPDMDICEMEFEDTPPLQQSEQTEGGEHDEAMMNLREVEEPAQEEPLPESLITILGNDGVTSDKILNCLPQLAVRWENVLKSGLKKESKESLDLKYETFLTNCPSLIPPKLNIEIKSSVSESALKRDARIVAEQKQVAAIITSVGLGLTTLIKQNPTIQGIEEFSDAARMLCQFHHEISKNRRNLLISGLNKDIKELMDNSPVIESMLFGNDFSEKVKASQAAKRLSAQSLKPTVPSKVIKKQNLNYKRPLRHQAPARQSGQRPFPKPGNKRNSNYQRPFYKKQPVNPRHQI